jgi:hypothetical protein
LSEGVPIALRPNCGTRSLTHWPPAHVVSLEGGLVKIDLREPRRELATSPRESCRARRLALRGRPRNQPWRYQKPVRRARRRLDTIAAS